MTAKLTQFESESIRSGYLPQSAVTKVSTSMRRYHGITDHGDGTMECRYHGTVPYEHNCRRPDETAGQFTDRALGQARDV